MHPAIKVIIGAILIIGAVAYVYLDMDPLEGGVTPKKALYTVVQGLVPPFIGVLGFFIVWLEMDEMKISKEMKSKKKK